MRRTARQPPDLAHAATPRRGRTSSSSRSTRSAADYLAKYRPASLERLASRGIVARGLIPPFPSKTFPSHYTIATGLYPGHHGILSNTFYDPALDHWFRVKDTARVRDGRWYGGVPIWVAAQREGVRSSVYFWPGSEGVVAGERPTYWSSYRASVPDSQRVDESIARLRLPAAERPHLVMIYLTDVDDTTHHYGPDTPHTAAAVASLDRALTRLLDSLHALPQRDSVNVVVLSDHGMSATVRRSRCSRSARCSRRRGSTRRACEMGDNGPVMSLWFRGDTALARRTLAALAHLPHARAYARGATPARWHLDANARAGDVLVVGRASATSSRRARAIACSIRGNHGWDPTYRADARHLRRRGPADPRRGNDPRVRERERLSLPRRAARPRAMRRASMAISACSHRICARHTERRTSRRHAAVCSLPFVSRDAGPTHPEREGAHMSERNKPHNGRDSAGNFRVKQVDLDDVQADPEGERHRPRRRAHGGAVADTGALAGERAAEIGERIEENRENVKKLARAATIRCGAEPA